MCRVTLQHAAPQRSGISVESVGGPGVDNEPVYRGDLAIQLQRPPAGIADEQTQVLTFECVSRVAIEIDGAQTERHVARPRTLGLVVELGQPNNGVLLNRPALEKSRR